MRFKHKLAALMHAQGLKLADLAARAGLGYETLRNYIKSDSERVPTVSNAIRIANVFRVSVEWLFDDDKGWPPPTKHENPPFEITPWPPNGLSWQELQAAVWAFVYQRELDRFWANSGPKVRLMEGNRELRDVRPDRFLGMIDSPSIIQDAIRAIRLAAADQSNAKKGRK